MEKEESTPKAAKRQIITQYEPFTVKASFLRHVGRTEEQELSEALPETGWGTVKPPAEDFDDGYAACALFIFGFFLFFPWLFAAFYWKSSNGVARVAAIMSGVLSPVALFFLFVYGSSLQ